MTIAFKCTSCGRGLQAKPEMAGKKTKCPGCATILTIPSGADAAPAPRPTAPAPAAAPAGGGMVACECGSKIRTKPEWAGKTIKCPKCASLIKVPAAATAAPPPAAKPAPKPPAPVDDDDPFGGGGISGPSDDEGFGGFTDDGADDEAPVTRPARSAAGRPAPAPAPKKKSHVGFLLTLLVLLVLLVGAGFSAYCIFVLDQNPLDVVMNKPPHVAGGTGLPQHKVDPNDPLTYMAADGVLFVNVRPEEIFKTKAVKALLEGAYEGPEGKANKEMADALGFSVADINSVAVSFKKLPSGKDKGFPGLAFVAIRKPIQVAGFDKAVQNKKLQKKENAKNATYYLVADSNPPIAVAKIGERVFVVGEEPYLIEYMVNDNASEGALAPAIKNASAGEHILFSGFIPSKEAVKDNPFLAPFADAKSVEVGVEGDKAVKATVKIEFPDAAKAEAGKKAIDGMLDEAKKSGIAPPPLDEALANVKPSVSGTSVVLTLETKLSLDEIIDRAQKMSPPPKAKTAPNPLDPDEEPKKIDDKGSKEESKTPPKVQPKLDADPENELKAKDEPKKVEPKAEPKAEPKDEPAPKDEPKKGEPKLLDPKDDPAPKDEKKKPAEDPKIDERGDSASRAVWRRDPAVFVSHRRSLTSATSALRLEPRL